MVVYGVNDSMMAQALAASLAGKSRIIVCSSETKADELFVKLMSAFDDAKYYADHVNLEEETDEA